MKKNTRFVLAGLAAVAAFLAPTAAAATDGVEDDSAAADNYCTRSFDDAQRTDMESFRDYDLETWKAGHDDDAITIFASGVWFQGRDRIAAVLHRHFENREAQWSWTELSRAVDGCKTATILYDATYAIPSIHFTQRAYVSVVYTFKQSRWLSVIDQSTLVAPS
ncbi:MAG TPA: hypothetical protein VFE14_05740 [Micromonosporaceae bacterium]|jgi:hypothetical protein|nr:hypothetical protein [Micromonosporaceae bacterium]